MNMLRVKKNKKIKKEIKKTKLVCDFLQPKIGLEKITRKRGKLVFFRILHRS
jgi:hypothetical protein